MMKAHIPQPKRSPLPRSMRVKKSAKDLGVEAFKRGDKKSALNIWKQYLERTDFADVATATNAGSVAMQLEEFEVSAAIFSKLVLKDPQAPGHLANLGASLIRLNRVSDARLLLEAALRLDPNFFTARVNLGAVYQTLGLRDKNLKNALEAVALHPTSTLAFNNLGSALSDMALFDEAKHAFETAHLLDPKAIDPLVNLAAAEARLNNPQSAIDAYERVLAILPPEAAQRREAVRFFLAFEYFKLGRIAEGWDCYEGGFSPLVPNAGARSPNRQFDVPRWQGEPLNGRRLLVWREQGIGDELRFGTCLESLVGLDGQVIVECDARLVEPLQRAFPSFLVRGQAFDLGHSKRAHFQDFDLQIPIGSLMQLTRRDLAAFAHSGGHIPPHPNLRAKWEARLAPYRGKKLVGVCWRSSKLDPIRNLKYANIQGWSALLSRPDVQVVNLQYGDCESEIRQVEAQYGIEVLRWPDLDMRDDLDDLFALISCLDLVVCTYTAVLHLAGSVGAPTIAMTNENAPENWVMLGTDHYPWYQTVHCVTWPAFEQVMALALDDDPGTPIA